MQRELTPRELDWVFCWRTSTGEVRPGARDAGALRYHPRAAGSERGLRTVVHGRWDAAPHPPKGPRLDHLGALARGCSFAEGFVTHGTFVPARTERELAVLEQTAHDAILAGDASEWSLAAVGARDTEILGLRINQSAQDRLAPPLLAGLVARVMAPWTLRFDENRIVYVDADGLDVRTLEADSVFDDEPLPDVAWRTGHRILQPESLPPEGSDEFEAVANEWAEVMMEWVQCTGIEITEDDARAHGGR